MGFRIRAIKNFIEAKRNAIKSTLFLFKVSAIWDEAKDYIRTSLNAGEIVDILEKSDTGFYIRPFGEDLDWPTREVLSEEFTVRTETGDIFIIEQLYPGIQDMKAADILNIYDKNKKLLYTSRKEAKRIMTPDIK